MQLVKKAVILAAGFGTRVLSFTKTISKVMYPIIDKPAIQYIVEEALSSGIEEIMIVVGINKESIMHHFKQNELLEQRIANKPDILKAIKQTNLPEIQYVEQTVIDGTAGATKLAKDFVDGEPFVLFFADEIMLGNRAPVALQLIKEYYKTNKSVLACKEVSTEEITKYSCVEFSSREGRHLDIQKITEKPKRNQIKSNISTLGRYVLTPDIFDYIENIEETVNGEKVISSAFSMMAKENKVIGYLFDGDFYDIGNKLSYIKSTLAIALQQSEFREPLTEFIKSLNL